MKIIQNKRMITVFTLCILIYFVMGASLTIFLVNRSMRQQALQEAESKARIILDRNMATHTYFSSILKPKVKDLAGLYSDKEYFEPAWMSSTYAIREIHNLFKEINPFGYYVKDAAISARNPANEADSFEKAFLEKMKREKNLESFSEIRPIEGKPYLLTLRKGEVVEDTCLQCHGDPNEAPKGLLKLYSSERSFHRQAGDLVSVVSMRIPLSEAYSEVSKISIELSALLVTGLAVLLGTLFFLYRRILFSPVALIREKALEIAGKEEHLGDVIPKSGSKELNELTEAFNEMSRKSRISRDQLENRVNERTRELKTANEQLRIEITERRRVAEEREKLVEQLQKTLSEVKTLKGIIPICASCKKIRDDRGYWNQVESYVREHTEAEFSHGICPECRSKLYPEF